jgi:UDPglucose 6-dehydrogenase
MKHGMGDGGSCHPRDNIALSFLARKYNLSFDMFATIMKARESQTEWLAELVINYKHKTHFKIVLLGKSYKPETSLTMGSPSILMWNILVEKGEEPDHYDPFVDDPEHKEGDIPEKYSHESFVFFIGTKHKQFVNYQFPKGSIVIDPFGYIPKSSEYKVDWIGTGT